MQEFVFRNIENTFYLTNLQYWITISVLDIPHWYIMCYLVCGCSHIGGGGGGGGGVSGDETSKEVNETYTLHASRFAI